MSLLPDEIERQVVERVFAQAESLRWELLPAKARSRQYSAWMEDSLVGGVLGQFMSPQAARVWLKDGPMKEYSRALYGHGKHASLIGAPMPGPDDLVRRALGVDWVVIEGSLEVKPMRVHVRNREALAGTERTFSWGSSRDFKHLVWAALGGAVQPEDWTLCVVARRVNPTPSNVVAQHRRIADRCGFEVSFVTL